MMQQLQLSFRPKKIQKVEYPEGLALEERFEKFHEEDPHVATMLTQMALQLKDKGRKHFGMKGLFETLRFWTALETKGEVFKLNNNYTSFYSRLIMRQTPELNGFFEVRERSSKSRVAQ